MSIYKHHVPDTPHHEAIEETVLYYQATIEDSPNAPEESVIEIFLPTAELEHYPESNVKGSEMAAQLVIACLGGLMRDRRMRKSSRNKWSKEVLPNMLESQRQKPLAPRIVLLVSRDLMRL